MHTIQIGSWTSVLIIIVFLLMICLHCPGLIQHAIGIMIKCPEYFLCIGTHFPCNPMQLTLVMHIIHKFDHAYCVIYRWCNNGYFIREQEMMAGMMEEDENDDDRHDSSSSDSSSGSDSEDDMPLSAKSDRINSIGVCVMCVCVCVHVCFVY